MSRPSAAPRRVFLVPHLSRIIFLLSSSATTGGRNRSVSTILLTSATTSPVSKIVDTLRNLQKSASEEQTVDGNNYRAVFNWCQETFSDRQAGHKQYLAIENELAAKLKVNTAVNRQLKDEVATLQNEMNEAETAIKQGSVLRQSEHEDYLREQKDAATMLGELNRASGALSGSSGAGSNKVSKALLLQVAQNVQALAARSSAGGGGQLYQSRTGELVSRLQDQDSTDTIQDARSVLEVLRELKSQFEQSLRSAESQERKALEEYDALIRMKKDVLFQLQTSKDAKDAMLAESEQAIAQIARSLEDAKMVSLHMVTKASSEYMNGVKKICGDLSNSWASRQSSVQDLLASLEGVVGALSGAGGGAGGSGQGAGGSEQQLVSFLQEQSTSSVGGGAAAGRSEDGSARSAEDDELEASLGMVAPGGGGSTSTSTVAAAPPGPAPIENRGTGYNYNLGSTRGDVESRFPSNSQQQVQDAAESQSTQMNQSALLQSSKELTFSSVKKMVSEMITQIDAATENEAEHKNWCENELSKNAAALNEKNTKLRRISTKTDNEKEALGALEMNLKTLSSETNKLNAEVMHFRELRLQEKALFAKTSQNHQVASQILQQAVTIFQRYFALLTEEKMRQRMGGSEEKMAATGFLSRQTMQAEDVEMSSFNTNTIQSLSNLQTKYQQLKEQCTNTENKAGLDFQLLQDNLLKNFLEKLGGAKTYRQNLKLQSASAFDADNEDLNQIQAQKNNAEKYLGKLQLSCKDILQHYDERNQRREENLKALQSAQDVISVDNADEVHAELSRMAGLTVEASAMGVGGTNSGAAGSFSGAAPKNVGGTMGGAVAASSSTGPRAGAEHSTQSNMLLDLQSLQTLSSMEKNEGGEAGGNTAAGLEMLPAA